MNEIIPSILVKTKEELLDKLIIIEPYVQRAHLDIADGIFVPNMTIAGPEEIDEVETSLEIGVHLMVTKPENHIARWLETVVDQIVFHIEATQKAQTVIDMIKEGEREVGIAINPKTPVTALESHIDHIDFVHFLTVEPGFYGAKFEDSVLDKISDFHYFYPDKTIQVDGAVNLETLPKLLNAGASKFVVGSYIFENHDVAKAIENLNKMIK